jgi:CubicO group peptidase (beta-lactamase class C family)
MIIILYIILKYIMEYTRTFNLLTGFLMPNYKPYSIIYQSKLKALDDALNDFLKKEKASGLAVGIAKGNKIIFEKGYGYQDIENTIPICTKSSLFRWASMSKMITSIIILKYCLNNNIPLNENVQKYDTNFNIPFHRVKQCKNNLLLKLNNKFYACLGGFVEYHLDEIEHSDLNHVDIESLLANRSGICAYDNTPYKSYPHDKEMKNPDLYTKDYTHFINYFIDKPFVSCPNAEYNYTTFGFMYAAYIFELLSKKKYMEHYDDFIGKHYDYKTLLPDKETHKHLYPNRCKGYKLSKPTDDTDVSFKLPGGGFMSNLEDGLQFCMNLDKKLTLYEKIFSWKTFADNPTYGLGFQIWDDFETNRFSVGHSGNQQKATTLLRYYPKDRTSLVILSNDEKLPLRKLRVLIEKYLF